MNISRNQDIDLIKVIAMFGVIGLHSWGAFMDGIMLMFYMSRVS